MYSMDYPLISDDISMRGILYIKQYLERLMENLLIYDSKLID